mmetsp:Transcript_5885/g.14469  ORF Transcript_5885/g.14469 Transcript_5885/m.14469 type:complete len:307 (-) Transcript_5885:866-1786(-)
MTIRVERQALLRVLRTPSPLNNDLIKDEPPIPSSIGSDDGDDEFVIIEELLPLCEKTKPLVLTTTSDDSDDDSQTSSAISSVLSEEVLDDEDDDDDDADSSATTSSRVSFKDELVTDVWTRPYTPTEDVPSLFYSSDTIAQFRLEYRLERKVLSELAVDPEQLSNVDEEELTSLLVPPTLMSSPTASSSCSSSVSTSSPAMANPLYRISRVVVVHNDKLETFVDPTKEVVPPQEETKLDVPSSPSSSSWVPLSESFCQPQQPQQHQEQHSLLSASLDSHHRHQDQDQSAENFFDNDSFWSGSLTWY